MVLKDGHSKGQPKKGLVAGLRIQNGPIKRIEFNIKESGLWVRIFIVQSAAKTMIACFKWKKFGFSFGQFFLKIGMQVRIYIYI